MPELSPDSDAVYQIEATEQPEATVIAGFSQYGLAGLAAVDFLVDHLDLEQTGFIRADGLPTITPFENGRPRQPTRLYSRDDLDVTVLVGELAVPVSMAQPFSEAILDWTEEADVDELAVLSGVPVPHGPDDHRTFYVATDDYREKRFGDDSPVPPMGAGFLDGTNGSLVSRGMDSPMGVCVYVTPVHDQVPDVEATIRLLDSLESVYGLGVDTAPLRSFADQVQQYYQNLAERLESERAEEQPLDRMYM
ncbi:proteasome assembly chaperone family protein [Halobaculum sp. P14]|uniref:proteasome assembly chaperone family protein n=1 Tax=Halobaculum sp. P14 TaxID=3421638 RepID=UPI003EBE96ED